jgi:hypothetical protein
MGTGLLRVHPDDAARLLWVRKLFFSSELRVFADVLFKHIHKDTINRGTVCTRHL